MGRPDKLSICVLTYGNELKLIDRCLQSLLPHLDGELVQDVRIGLNAVTTDVDNYVSRWTEDASKRVPVILCKPHNNVNALKYPLMRSMLRIPSAPLAEWTMWFDDDSYLEPHFSMKKYLDLQADFVGWCWYIHLRGRQYEWLNSRPWCQKSSKRFSQGEKVRFITGGWWLIRSKLLLINDWPDKDIRHNGGDVALGQLALCDNWNIVDTHDGVAVNADELGFGCKSPRRGVSMEPVGTTYDPEIAPDHSHHNFGMHIETSFTERLRPRLRLPI